jgi:hypothetical protein
MRRREQPDQHPYFRFGYKVSIADLSMPMSLLAHRVISNAGQGSSGY